MKLFATVFFVFWISFSSWAQQLQLIPDAVIKGRPYISAFEQGMDGSYFFASQIDHVDGNPASSLTKTDAQGWIVTSFASVETNSHIVSIRELPGGKILISGWFTEINDVKVGPVVRLNSDGTVDDSFVRWTGIADHQHASQLAVQRDGKIVVVGSFSNYLGSNYTNIVRLNQDGTVDETFAANVTDLPFVPFIEVDQNDDLAVSSGTKLYKLTPDGHIHPDFSPVEIGAPGSFSKFKFFKDGEIIVAGSFDSFAGVPVKKVARITSDGAVDPSFNPGEFISYVWDLQVKADDSFVVATHDGLKIFDQNGTAMHVEGLAAYSIERMFLDDSENLLLYGWFFQINGVEKPYVARLTEDFAFDHNFRTFFSYTTGIETIAARGDGKIFVTGSFYGINDVRANILRIHLDGSVDNSFVAANEGQDVTSIAVQDDGKLLVASSNSLMRLIATGKLDNTFHQGIFGGLTRSYINSVKIHEGKIYVSGSFDSFDGYHSPGIIRFNPDGTVDNTFQSNLPPSTYISGFAFQSGDRIVATGLIPFPEGRKRLIRLSESGYVDGTFSQSDHASNGIRDIKVDTKDKIYLAGDFLDLNGQQIRGLAKLMPDGAVDNLFQFSFSISEYPHFAAMAMISDNEIVLGSSSSGIGLVVIDSTGQVIHPEYEAGGTKAAIVASFFDGKTLFLGGRVLSGDLNTVSGIAYVNFIKISGSIDHLEASRVTSTKIQLTWQNNFSRGDGILVERSEDGGASYTEIASLSAEANAYEDSSVSAAASYSYRVRAANSGSYSTYSNESYVEQAVVGIEDQTRHGLRAYPNPTKGLLHIDGEFDYPATAKIFNTFGKEVSTVEVVNGTADVGALSPAIYVLVLKADNRIIRQVRFVKK